jgi:hypothetical protein
MTWLVSDPAPAPALEHEHNINETETKIQTNISNAYRFYTIGYSHSVLSAVACTVYYLMVKLKHCCHYMNR